jgi:hypothetical protein
MSGGGDSASGLGVGATAAIGDGERQSLESANEGRHGERADEVIIAALQEQLPKTHGELD